MKKVAMIVMMTIGCLLVFSDYTQEYQQFSIIYIVVGAIFSVFGGLIGIIIWDENRQKSQKDHGNKSHEYKRIMTF